MSSGIHVVWVHYSLPAETLPYSLNGRKQEGLGSDTLMRKCMYKETAMVEGQCHPICYCYCTACSLPPFVQVQQVIMLPFLKAVLFAIIVDSMQ